MSSENELPLEEGVPEAILEANAARRRIEAAASAFVAGEDREGAFRLLFETYAPAVERFFSRKGISTQDGLDLTQETFVGIYRGLAGWRREARLDTWIYRIATTTYLKWLRARGTAKRTGTEVTEEALGSAEPRLHVPAEQLTAVLSQERRRILDETVAGLPDQMRRTLLLYAQQGLKYREIAVVLRISIETVKVHLFQARKRLRERLGEDWLRDLPP